jgi:glucose dehydrogenase
MPSHWLISILCAVVLLGGGSREASEAQQVKAPPVAGTLPGIRLISPLPNGTWTIPAGDYAHIRFSPLDQINTETVQNLKIMSTLTTGIPHGHEGQPLVVNNTRHRQSGGVEPGPPSRRQQVVDDHLRTQRRQRPGALGLSDRTARRLGL